MAIQELGELQRNWEGFARSDPCWAVLTDPRKKDGGWDLGEFFATGENEISAVLSLLDGLGLKVDRAGAALDFGCGIGRLTQALAGRFGKAIGVDISPTMVAHAERHNRWGTRCVYFLNDGLNLPGIGDGSLAFVYSSVVLQHMESRFALGYIGEFCRGLGPGGLAVFQVLDSDKGPSPLTAAEKLAALRVRLAVKTRTIRVLTALGWVRGTAGTAPPRVPPYSMEMHCIPEDVIRTMAVRWKVDVLDVRLTNSTDTDFNGGLRYLDREPDYGFVSKQYVVRKSNITTSA
jgi:SAM-dependent methyltransferase